MNKKLIIICLEKQDNSVRYVEVVFYEYHYQHLTELQLVDKNNNVIYGQPVNFYLGLSKTENEYMPSPALCKNIKNLTDTPSQVWFFSSLLLTASPILLKFFHSSFWVRNSIPLPA